jgi:hypothetical protein
MLAWRGEKMTKDAYFVYIANRIKTVLISFLLRPFEELALKNHEKQEHLIHGTSWDNLIILDACRYDYFEREYDRFIEGELRKVRSPASNTYTWLKRVFNKRHDVTVYGSHPVLNSLGIRRYGYTAQPHFKRIVDVWKWGWDKSLGTVPPGEVNKSVLADIKSGSFRGRNIIWYMQPHAPWIGETRLTEYSEGWDDKRHVYELWKKIIRGEISADILRQAYRDNLRLVLQNVSELIPYLDGKTIVTSDHGELLGERGMFEHPRYSKLRALCEVPWLVVERREKKTVEADLAPNLEQKTLSKDDREKVKERLMALGYL